MTAKQYQARWASRGRLWGYMALAVLAVGSLAASGCSSTQTRYSIEDEPQASTWQQQTGQEVWIDMYTGNAHAER